VHKTVLRYLAKSLSCSAKLLFLPPPILRPVAGFAKMCFLLLLLLFVIFIIIIKLPMHVGPFISLCEWDDNTRLFMTMV